MIENIPYSDDTIL